MTEETPPTEKLDYAIPTTTNVNLPPDPPANVPSQPAASPGSEARPLVPSFVGGPVPNATPQAQSNDSQRPTEGIAPLSEPTEEKGEKTEEPEPVFIFEGRTAGDNSRAEMAYLYEDGTIKVGPLA